MILGRKTKNYISSFIVLGVSTLTNFYLTTVFIENIGDSGLAVVRIALGIPVYISLFSFSIMAALSKYLTDELQLGDYIAGSKTINTSIFSLIFLYVSLAPLMAVGFYYLSEFLGVGPEGIRMFFLMYVFSAITTLSVLFVSPAYAQDRVDVYNINKFIAVVLQAFFMLLSFAYFGVSYIAIGASFVLGAGVALVYSVSAFNEFKSGMNLGFNWFSIAKLRSLFFVTKWVFVENIGLFVLLTFDVLYVSFLLGVNEAGRYSIFIQVAVALITVSKAFSNLYGPRLYSAISNLNCKESQRLMNGSMIVIGGSLSVLCAFVAAMSGTVVELWIGPGYGDVAGILQIGIIFLGVVLSTLPMSYVCNALLRVRVSALTTLFSAISHIFLAYLLSVAFGLGVLGFLCSWLLCMSLRNVVFPLWFSAKVEYLSARGVQIRLLLLLLVSLVNYFFSLALSSVVDGWLALFTSGIFVFLVNVTLLLIVKGRRWVVDVL